MASLQDIRRRIRSVKNTQQVTKAMKMISAVKLRKSQERLLSMRPFSSMLHNIIGQVVARFEADTEFAENSLAQAFFQPREEKNIHLVIIASDKGLCGGFNANLLKAVEAFFQEHSDQITRYYLSHTHNSDLSDTGLSSNKLDFLTGLKAARLSNSNSSTPAVVSQQSSSFDIGSLQKLGEGDIDVIGRRASEWAKKIGITPTFESVSLNPNDYKDVARKIAQRAAQEYSTGEIDALYAIYNYFTSAVSQTPRVVRIFPLQEIPQATAIQYLLEPDMDTVFNELLPQYIETELYRALLESSTSEHAARMAAMDKATSNAGEMIDSLTLHMNKVRQAAITNQIIEVVSGAAIS
ncbi:MAG: F0F1 ATP synthase subunit gamma [Holophagaceae bacterium]|nr:F0F1 ATP synthase subunit gamma [Holophagaceae bacterium]